jgi:succinylarginine dihydrolase
MKTLNQRIETQIAEYRNRVIELEAVIVNEKECKVEDTVKMYTEFHNRQIAVAQGKILVLQQAIADFDTLLNFCPPQATTIGELESKGLI